MRHLALYKLYFGYGNDPIPLANPKKPLPLQKRDLAENQTWRGFYP